MIPSLPYTLGSTPHVKNNHTSMVNPNLILYDTQTKLIGFKNGGKPAII